MFDDLDASWDIAYAIPSGYRPEHSSCVLMIEDDAGKTWDLKIFDMINERDSVFSTPDRQIFCAVAGKTAYFIHARKPGAVVDYNDDPVRQKLLPDAALGQVIYVHDHGFEAFGPAGKLWEVAVDGCGILDITFEGETLSAHVIDYDGESTWQVFVNRVTGELKRA